MTVTYRTMVLHVPPTPLGLLHGRWVVDHWCNDCCQRVETGDLVDHARQHDQCLPNAGRLGHNEGRPAAPHANSSETPVLQASPIDNNHRRR
ncbi:MAG: hypothetical protein M0Z95_24500 [Actinomycetota bacterium]|nr:hypothetical protein [Actinomycetota bacterium]